MLRLASPDDSTNQWLRIVQVQTGPLERSPAALTAVVTRLAPDEKARYKSKGRSTFCNIFVWDATTALGCEIPHWVMNDGTPAEPGAGGAHEQRANDLPGWLAGPGAKLGWKQLRSEFEARACAETGMPTVVCWDSRQDDVSGHIALLVPGGYAQAGAQNYRCAPLNACFGPAKHTALTWWVHG